jgi:1-deoxy-D-xylulose-5-phosphate reductoisomerase
VSVPRRVTVLGSTGSIGTQALEVIASQPDALTVTALAAGRLGELLLAQLDTTGVRRVAVADRAGAAELRAARPALEVLDGPEGVRELAAGEADLVLNGVAGAAGLGPTLAALRQGTPVALANKESLVIGGPVVVAAADAAGGRATHLLPVDSEHSALAQCLRAGDAREVARLTLTASGGPFRGRTAAELAAVTPRDALAHPTWSMGPLVTVNSATLMNKGLELIEAALLFDVPFDRLAVTVHPQSIVHALVTFVDGSTVAQLSPPDMRLPIQLALTWPVRLGAAWPRLDLEQALRLDFEPADRVTFPSLDLAEAAGRAGGTHPAVLNAANEVAVAAFLAGRLPFIAIPVVVHDVLDAWRSAGAPAPNSEEDVLAADAWGRRRATELTERTAPPERAVLTDDRSPR